MGYTIKNNTKIAIKEETVEGTYEAPDAGSDFVRVTEDGVTMDPSKEVLERNLLGGSIGSTTPRTGMLSVSGSLKCEMKASGTEGLEPEYGLLMESGLGNVRSAVTKTSSDEDGATYSDSQIALADLDAGTFLVGDIVTTKRSGAFHTSPVSAVSDVAGSVSITLLIADPAGAYVDGIEISAVSTYFGADSGHPAFSVAKYIEDAVLEKGIGCKTSSIAMENFTTGQVPNWSFSFDGIKPDKVVSALSLTPSYDVALPPIVLEACVYQNGVSVAVNELSFSIDNELGKITSTCAANGSLSSRVTKRSVSGSFNPYKADDSVAQYDKFESGENFSLFGFAKVPTAVAGEYEDVVAYYMPNCMIADLSEADKDGVLQDAIGFQATTGNDDDENDIYISFN